MVIINEWLPNPSGSDATGEWIELFNSGSSAQDITGWRLAAGAKGKYVFPKTIIQSGQYLVVPRTQSKLTLRNSDEKVSLYDAKGALVDSSSFVGLAQEGKSFSRISSQDAAQNFIFTTPTPGAQNDTVSAITFTNNAYPVNMPLHPVFGVGEFLLLAFAAAVVVTSLVFYALKTNENSNDLFFGKY